MHACDAARLNSSSPEIDGCSRGERRRGEGGWARWPATFTWRVRTRPESSLIAADETRPI